MKRHLMPHSAAAEREAFYRELRRDMSSRLTDFDPLASELCFTLAQTMGIAEATLSGPAQRAGLTLSGINVLIILFKHAAGGCPLNALSRLLVVTRANITG